MSAAPVREHPRPYGFERLLEAVKADVAVERLATDAGADLKRYGDDLRGFGVCHGGDNPTALVVQPKKARWWCFRCDEGGDILDLYQRIHGHDDKRHALINLAGEYGVEPPRRPERWHGWQSEKVRRLNGMRDVLAGSYRRRLFRLYRSYLAGIEDPREREQEARAIWDDLALLSRGCAELRITQRAAS
jgi:DNA primase